MLTPKNVRIVKKVNEFSFPTDSQFKVKIAFLPKDEWKKIVEDHTFSGWKNGKQVDKLDEEPFYAEFAKKTILGWSGLTVKTLKKIAPVQFDADVKDPDVIEYSQEWAQFLLIQSTEFDQWVTGIQNHLEAFDSEQKEAAEKNSSNTPIEKLKESESGMPEKIKEP